MSMRSKLTGYDVGALLYCPANAHGSIVGAIVEQRFPTPYSLAFCLEDTVREDAVADAERMLRGTLSRIASAAEGGSFFLPPIFVRVRSPEQLLRLAEEYAPFSSILRGFILPKFFLENCGAYLAAIRSIGRTEEYFYMPVFESAAMIPPQTRREALTEVRAQLDTVSGSILNIRVGGNDLSHAFGLRRPANRTIYDLRPVADILIDIVAAFGTQYVVSGPVWEYYSGEGWEEGLRREMELDRSIRRISCRASPRPRYCGWTYRRFISHRSPSSRRRAIQPAARPSTRARYSRPSGGAYLAAGARSSSA